MNNLFVIGKNVNLSAHLEEMAFGQIICSKTVTCHAIGRQENNTFNVSAYNVRMSVVSGVYVDIAISPSSSKNENVD